PVRLTAIRTAAHNANQERVTSGGTPVDQELAEWLRHRRAPGAGSDEVKRQPGLGAVREACANGPSVLALLDLQEARPDRLADLVEDLVKRQWLPGRPQHVVHQIDVTRITLACHTCATGSIRSATSIRCACLTRCTAQITSAPSRAAPASTCGRGGRGGRPGT